MPATTVVTGMRTKPQFISLDNQACGAFTNPVDTSTGLNVHLNSFFVVIHDTFP